ncbi:sugar transporter [Rhizobium ruizarguesonis]|uniref:Sugar transporter n=1 Tax=Rhizobium ruizarguesonis TaxID=2081791 RepID=A0ABY1XCR1_9HYPH|nr:sugar transporter [Rhizobium ruizarguesonis]NKJ76849.1 sugar transporter [Rhizobium leguminosarum bv. viciae]MBC2805155.1 sugar transporter [Rhizobium ruizarguesonis]NKQ75456.1 sugar transporter [Rhizobium ruizarguesonis]NKQ77140.1 sugar transporter [Rhizobium ruizarguesonis]TAU27754.1 sugar transporter [Rhizobium ruizarguesonis]
MVVARSGVYRKLAYSGIVVAMFAGMNSSAFAAACLGPASLTSVDISGFSANPAVLLDMSDPLVLSSRVRALVGSSNDALSLVIEQAKKASAAQMAAIGSGLARAANSCQVPDPQFKLAIEKAVADAAIADPNLAPLLAAFAKVLAEGGTAALGPGASAAAASGIGNDGQVGQTGPGADDGTPFDGAATTAGTLKVSNAGADSSTTTTTIVSTGAGGQSSTDPTQSTSQSVPVIQ